MRVRTAIMNATVASEVNLTSSEQCQSVLANLGQINTTELSSKIIIGVVLATLAILTFGGNLLVFLALTLGRGRPLSFSMSMTLTLSLVTADLLLSVTVMPLGAYVVLGDSWILGKILCRLFNTVDIFLCSASILHLSGLAFDRYLAICRPFLHMRTTKAWARALSAALWTLAFLLAFPVFLPSWHADAAEQDETSRCLMDLYHTGQACVWLLSPVYQEVVIPIVFLLPLLLIIGFHVPIYLVSRDQRRQINSFQNLGFVADAVRLDGDCGSQGREGGQDSQDCGASASQVTDDSRKCECETSVQKIVDLQGCEFETSAQMIVDSQKRESVQMNDDSKKQESAISTQVTDDTRRREVETPVQMKDGRQRRKSETSAQIINDSQRNKSGTSVQMIDDSGTSMQVTDDSQKREFQTSVKIKDDSQNREFETSAQIINDSQRNEYEKSVQTIDNSQKYDSDTSAQTIEDSLRNESGTSAHMNEDSRGYKADTKTNPVDKWKTIDQAKKIGSPKSNMALSSIVDEGICIMTKYCGHGLRLEQSSTSNSKHEDPLRQKPDVFSGHVNGQCVGVHGGSTFEPDISTGREACIHSELQLTTAALNCNVCTRSCCLSEPISRQPHISEQSQTQDRLSHSCQQIWIHSQQNQTHSSQQNQTHSSQQNQQDLRLSDSSQQTEKHSSQQNQTNGRLSYSGQQNQTHNSQQNQQDFRLSDSSQQTETHTSQQNQTNGRLSDSGQQNDTHSSQQNQKDRLSDSRQQNQTHSRLSDSGQQNQIYTSQNNQTNGSQQNQTHRSQQNQTNDNQENQTHSRLSDSGQQNEKHSSQQNQKDLRLCHSDPQNQTHARLSDSSQEQLQKHKASEQLQGPKKRLSILTQSRREDHKAIKTVLCLVLCFVVCWLPLFAALFVQAMQDSPVVPSSIITLFTWLGYVNSALNPLLYYRFNSHIRLAMRRVLGCRAVDID